MNAEVLFHLAVLASLSLAESGTTNGDVGAVQTPRADIP